MHIDKYNEAWALAPVLPQNQSAADVTPMLQMQYVPTLGSGGALATCALINNSSMTVLIDGATPAGLDIIGTSGIMLLSAAAYDTLGELNDYINGRRAYRSYLIAALRADESDILLAKSAASIMGDTGLTFYGDTSVNKGAIIPGTAGTEEIVGMAISGEKFVNNGNGGHVKDADDFCESAMLYGEALLTFTGVGGIRIYTANQVDDEIMIYNQTLTSTTEQNFGVVGTVQASGLNNIFVKSRPGERLICRAGTPTAFSAYTKFNFLGKTAVLRSNRLVDSINFTIG